MRINRWFFFSVRFRTDEQFLKLIGYNVYGRLPSWAICHFDVVCYKTIKFMNTQTQFIGL